jgi:hypothetical protein
MTDLNRRQMLGAGAALAYAHAAPSHAASAPPLLANALMATGPHPSLGQEAETYGRFIGRWRGEYKIFTTKGTDTGSIEVTFGWILEGRAIQDSGWLLEGYGPDADAPGSTLRIYDPDIKAWRIFYIDPMRRTRAELVGRRVGNDVIHQGYGLQRVIKWVFTDVMPDSFTWRGYSLADDGEKWGMDSEFRFRRVT